MDTDQHQKEFSENFLKNVFEMWVNPEVVKRKSQEIIDNNFELKAAQIIFPIGSENIVRLNNEVKIILDVAYKPEYKNEGTEIKLSDLLEKVQHIRGMRLTENDIDFGHITVLRVGDVWISSFSFIYDISKSKAFYEKGKKFLKSAKSDIESGNYDPAIESLSVAAENLALARLYLLPDKEIRSSKTHGTIQSKVNRYAKSTDIINSSYKNAFNTLLKKRDEARYDVEFSTSENEVKGLATSIEDLAREILGFITLYE